MKVLIKAGGFTQLRFAEYVGIEYSTLIAILAGKRRVYLHTYMKLITALNITDMVLISQTLPKENMREHIDTFLKLMPVFSSLSSGNIDLMRATQNFQSNDDELCHTSESSMNTTNFRSERSSSISTYSTDAIKKRKRGRA